jgi:8-oxo-dGTP pyrophosphatase MutT (NUDIX family)
MDRFQVIPAAYLLLLRGDGPELEVLLQRRGPDIAFMPGHWATAAAGHVELGESVFVAAAREAAEELGIVVDPADITPLCTMQRTLPGNVDPVEQRVDYFLTTRVWLGEPSVVEPQKATEIGWFRPARLPAPMVPHEEYLLGLLGDRLGSGEPLPAVVTFGF